MAQVTIPAETRRKIETVRNQLLDFHKLLMDGQKAEYERDHGPVLSPGAYLDLVLNHADFEWLRQLSGLIVAIDEMLAPRSTAGAAEADAAVRDLESLMNQNAEGKFQERLRVVLGQSTEAAEAHSQILRALTD